MLVSKETFVSTMDRLIAADKGINKMCDIIYGNPTLNLFMKVGTDEDYLDDAALAIDAGLDLMNSMVGKVGDVDDQYEDTLIEYFFYHVFCNENRTLKDCIVPINGHQYTITTPASLYDALAREE